jgi:hypothetical protein
VTLEVDVDGEDDGVASDELFHLGSMSGIYIGTKL